MAEIPTNPCTGLGTPLPELTAPGFLACWDMEQRELSIISTAPDSDTMVEIPPEYNPEGTLVIKSENQRYLVETDEPTARFYSDDGVITLTISPNGDPNAIRISHRTPQEAAF